jgi:hypothetical protein
MGAGKNHRNTPLTFKKAGHLSWVAIVPSYDVACFACYNGIFIMGQNGIADGNRINPPFIRVNLNEPTQHGD